MKTIARVLAALLIIVSLQPLYGAQNPNTSRGFNADGIYDLNDIDSVNTFSGGVTLTIPIGQTYTAGDRLKYGFTLTYNSSLWDLERRGSGGTIRTEAVPGRSFNAGLGWTLTLGELRFHDHVIYISPDGAAHSFKANTLHFGGDEAVAADVRYTRDGSYLRMRKVLTAGGQSRIIDLPDGTSHEFACVNLCNEPFTNDQTRFELRRITDAFGNEVTIEREAEPQGEQSIGTTWEWTVREMSEAGLQTEHYITFNYNPDVPYRWVVAQVELEVSTPSFTPDQPISQRRWATYIFNYFQGQAARAYRGPLHTATPAMTQVQPTTNDKVWVPILQSVTLPDNSQWKFQYYDTPASEASAPLPSVGRHFWTAPHDRILTRVTYPTGGGLRYVWGSYLYPRRSCYHPTERDPFPKASYGTGLLRRYVVDRNGNDDGQPWRYLQSTMGGQPTIPDYPYICQGGHTFVNTVVDPLANVTNNYFSVVVATENGVAGASPQDYALPISVTQPDPAGGARLLSTRTFQCPSTVPFDTEITPRYDALANAANPEPICGGPLRESYVRYESGGLDCHPSDDDNGPSCLGANRRMAAMRTVYHDDGDSWTLQEHSDFDGLGHFRETQTSGNFYSKNGIAGSHPRGDLKVQRTKWNANTTFSLSPEQFVNFPAPTQRWILETYSEMTQEDRATVAGEPAAKGGIARSEYFFDDRGFLTQKRVLGADGRAGTDLITTFNRVDDSAGRIRIQERYYGGDDESLSTSDLPVGSLGTPDYAIDLTYRFGTLEKKEYKTCDGLVTLLTAERNEIDPATGLSMSARDTSGAITTFLYDLMGRVSQARPPGEALTKYTYPIATDSTPAKVVIRRENNNAGTLQESQVEYDGLGRIAAERKRLPENNRWSRRETTYYPTGWKQTESTYGEEGTTNLGITKFLAYDAFGRILSVEHPESDPAARVHTTTYDYDGVRQVTQTVTGTAVNSSNYGTTVQYENFDSQGRVHQLRESSAGVVATVYEYDSSDRLVKVDSGNQSRTFEYDNRGFLKNEKHPELGSAGITYGKYDALGHAHERYFGATQPASARNELDLTFGYDGAERLRSVKQPKTGHYLKQFAYYEGSAPARLHGKLRRTQRSNWVPDPSATGTPDREIVVTEVYEYYASSHRISSKRVTAPGVKMVTTFDYDQLGNLKNIQYPALTVNCDPASNPNCIAAGTTRSVDYEYTLGHLTKVPGYLRNLYYHANGMVSKIVHENDVSWIQDVPLRNLRRPTNYRIEGTSNNQNWNSGTYKYDAAANIFKIDSDTFTYDGANRLVTAAMTGGTQSYQYDRHGNLTNFAGTNIPISSTTNRLNGPNVQYDSGGNLKQWVDPRQTGITYKYTYDPFHLVTHLTGGTATTQSLGRIHLYDADDERVAVIDYVTARPKIRETWSARDVENSVIRDFERLYDPGVTPSGGSAPARGWSWKTDYILRDGLLAATVDATGVRYVHLDHLGTPRAVTNAAGARVDDRHYRPFGEEIVARPDPLRLKFTGHERDDDGTTLPYGDVDYMHARYYNASIGRFLSLDKADDTDIFEPQSWNKYTYARNNPLKYNDPDGNIIETAWDVVNVGMDVVSLASNVAAGNWGGAALDAAGLIVDAVATAVPCVPGGAGVAIKAARAADKVVDVAKKVDKVRDAARAADKVVDSAKAVDKVNDASKYSRKAYKRVPQSTRKEVLREGATCTSCGKKADTIDHLESQKAHFERKGKHQTRDERSADVNRRANLDGKCRSCNSSKRDLSQEEFARRQRQKHPK
jgi:RHS repeat-associated protein